MSLFRPLLWLSAAAAALPCAAQQPTPQRTIMENRVIRDAPGDRNKPAQPQEGASGRTIDSILDSTTDLNSIRDGYLRRVAGDGCPPDLAIKVADLRARLHEDAPRMGAAAPANAAQSRQNEDDLESSLLILAAKWFDAAPSSPAVATGMREAERARLLELVLSPKAPATAATNGADAAQMKAELERLLAGCRQAGR